MADGETVSSSSLCGGRGGRVGDGGVAAQGGCSGGSIRETRVTRPSGPSDGCWGLTPPRMVEGGPSKGCRQNRGRCSGGAEGGRGGVSSGPRPTEHKGRAWGGQTHGQGPGLRAASGGGETASVPG